MRAALTIALLLSGCYASHVADIDAAPVWEDPTPVSGTRIRARHFVSESGERFFAGWYDVELGDSCWFGTARDGRLHCAPGRGHAGPYFRDPACAELVLTVASRCPTSAYALLRRDGDLCAPRGEGLIWESYRVGPEIEVSPLWVGDHETCEASRTSTTGSRAHELTRVPLEDLVSAEVLVPPEGAGRLGRTWMVADDGATAEWSLYDHQRNEECRLPLGVGISQAEVPCVPRSAARASIRGRACDEIWTYPYRCDVLADLAVHYRGELCDPQVEVHQVEEAAEPEFGTECEGSTDVVWHRTSPAGPDATPVLRRELRGDGRLQARVWVGDDRFETFHPIKDGFYDRELDLVCYPWEVRGGVRCLPNIVRDGFVASRFSFFEPPLYADAACTRPAASLREGSCGDLVAWKDNEEPRLCPAPPWRFFRVGEPIDELYEDSDGPCARVTYAPSPWRQRHALQEIPMARFARFDVVVD